MSDRQDEAFPSFLVRCLPGPVYIVEDPKTGIRMAGADFDSVRSQVHAASRCVSEKSVERPFMAGKKEYFVGGWAGYAKIIVISTPLFLSAVMFVSSINGFRDVLGRAQINSVGGATMFNIMRQGVNRTARALEGMAPENRDELLGSIRSIVHSLQPFVHELKPIIDDLSSSSSSGEGRESEKSSESR